MKVPSSGGERNHPSPHPDVCLLMTEDGLKLNPEAGCDPVFLNASQVSCLPAHRHLCTLVYKATASSPVLLTCLVRIF